MFHHISIGVRDVVRAVKFYDAVLEPLGYRRVMNFLPNAVGYGDDHPHFWVQLPREGNSSRGNGSHVAFAAADKDAVNEFYARALRMGGRDNGAPGPRPNYGPDYYGAFVIDLDDNHIEAVVMWSTKTVTRKSGKKNKAGVAKKTAEKKPVTPKPKPTVRRAATRRAAPRVRGRRR